MSECCGHEFVDHDVRVVLDVTLLIMCTKPFCLCRSVIRLRRRFDWFPGGPK